MGKGKRHVERDLLCKDSSIVETAWRGKKRGFNSYCRGCGFVLKKGQGGWIEVFQESAATYKTYRFCLRCREMYF